ncbi:MAG: hypothetical protein ACT4NY_00475 [Pseudonocardiales bacterium]
MTDAAGKPRVLSGIAATDTLHIGNYIGALSVWAQEQDSYDNCFVAVRPTDILVSVYVSSTNWSSRR